MSDEEFWRFNIRLELNLMFKSKEKSRSQIISWLYNGTGFNIGTTSVDTLSKDDAIMIFNFIEKREL